MIPDIVGTIFVPTGAMITDGDTQYPEMSPIAGYFVTFPADVPGLEAYKVTPQPTTPYREYAGKLGILYQFASESEYQTAISQINLADIDATIYARKKQRLNIKQAFIEATNAPVTDANGITWEGSKESGTSIFLGCQLMQQTGATMITVFDAAKEPHQMTIAEGMAVAALIGMQYQTVLAKKNALYAQIDVAKTVSAVQAIVW